MEIDGSRTKPLFEKTEHWSSPLTQDEALTAISKAFASDKARIHQDGELLEIRTGSNLQYRLWGNLFSWSRRKIPVALTVRVRAAEHGVHIDAHAFDTFGFRLTDHTFFGARENFEDRLEVLLRQAAAAAEASPKA